MARLYGRAGRLTAQNGGCRPGQEEMVQAVAAKERAAEAHQVAEATAAKAEVEAAVGLGRIVALY